MTPGRALRAEAGVSPGLSLYLRRQAGGAPDPPGSGPSQQGVAWKVTGGVPRACRGSLFNTGGSSPGAPFSVPLLTPGDWCFSWVSHTGGSEGSNELPGCRLCENDAGQGTRERQTQTKGGLVAARGTPLCIKGICCRAPTHPARARAVVATGGGGAFTPQLLHVADHVVQWQDLTARERVPDPHTPGSLAAVGPEKTAALQTQLWPLTLTRDQILRDKKCPPLLSRGAD